MSCLAVRSFRSFLGVGARMSMSMWNSNHQNMSDWFVGVEWTIILIIVAISLLNLFLLLPSRKRLHVDRKCGGSLL